MSDERREIRMADSERATRKSIPFTQISDSILSPATFTAFHYSEFIQPGVSGVLFSFLFLLIHDRCRSTAQTTLHHILLLFVSIWRLRIYFFSTFLTSLHFWRVDRRASRGRMLLLCSSLSFLSFLVCGSRSRVRFAEGIPAGFSAATGSTLPACLLLLVVLSV